MAEYILLYGCEDRVEESGRYEIIKAKNILEVCKIWYEATVSKMSGVNLRIWEKFKPEEAEDCMAWINTLLYDDEKISGIIIGMWQMAKPSKE